MPGFCLSLHHRNTKVKKTTPFLKKFLKFFGAGLMPKMAKNKAYRFLDRLGVSSYSFEEVNTAIKGQRKSLLQKVTGLGPYRVR